MISVLLYGRNDNHGYNLHKRAAISLNAISEVLTPEIDDEIIFVDYNTPDDMPTFPEAISDTLSEKTKGLLRILRVRPEIHARYASRTHLNALESIARNAAVRRSLPNNKWMLSTNTDIVLTLEDGVNSLAELLANLPDGFYQLPRFELPEALWESLDRSDGAQIIANVRNWARRFHLNEIIYATDEMLYDAPGDFQLALRSDLIRFHGFHEGMLRGWHVDANLSARMRRVYGSISSLAGRVAAYHCDHTRQASLLHSHDRSENDLERYTAGLASPHIPEQADDWGLPNDTLEEIRLGRDDTSLQYVGALAKAIPESQKTIYEAAYRPDSFGDLRYPVLHVLPFVLDYLTTVPRGTRVLYAGARADIAAKILQAMSDLGFSPALLPEGFDWLPADHAKRLRLDEALSQVDLLIFEFGTGEPSAERERSPGDLERLRATRRTLVLAGEYERSRSPTEGGRQRRLAAINAVHNEFETLVSSLVSSTLTPFGTRVRHGYMIGSRGMQSFDIRSVWRDVQKISGRLASITLPEQHDLARVARVSAAVGANQPLPESALTNAETLLALVRHAQVSEVAGMTQSGASSLAARLEQERPSLALLGRFPELRTLQDQAERLKASSCIADLADWDRPDFAELVVRHFGGPNSLTMPERNLWLWERAMSLALLRRAGFLHARARILLVVTQSEMLADVLADYVGEIDVAAPAYGNEQPGGAKAPLFTFTRSGDGATSSQTRDEGHYDAVLCLQRTLIAHGPMHAPAALTEMRRLVKDDGLVLLSNAVALSKVGLSNGFRLEALREDRFAKALKNNRTGLRLSGPIASRLSVSTLDRSLQIERPDLRYRPMVMAEPHHVWTEGLIALRKERIEGSSDREAAIEGLTRALAVVFGSPGRSGSIRDRGRAIAAARAEARDPRYARWRTEDTYWMRRLTPGSGVIVDGEAFVVPAGFTGNAIFGPWRVLGSGDWRLSFRAAFEGATDQSPSLRVEVALGGGVIQSRLLVEQELDGRELAMDFIALTGPLFAKTGNRMNLLVETRFAPLTAHAWRIWDIRLSPLLPGR